MLQRRILGKSTTLIVVTLVVMADPSAAGADRTWVDPTGGVFHGASNWSPQGAPGSSDTARFDLNTDYMVTFGNDAASRLVNVSEGLVTFDVGPFIYTLRGAVVGDNPGDVAVLDLFDGMVSVSPLASPLFVRIGKDADATGELTIIGGAIFNSTEVVIVGDGGAGTLTADAGGTVSTGRVFIADDPQSTGAILVDDAGSTWVSTDVMFVGNGGAATFDVTDGGDVTTAGTLVADDPSSSAQVLVTGIGSTWTEAGNFTLGKGGAATLTIGAGGSLSVGGVTRLGDDAGAAGQALINGAGATLTTGPTLFVGNNGDGQVQVGGGGALVTNRVKIGDETGSQGAVEVDGPGSTWTDADEIFIGNRGAGSMAVAGGGTVSGVRATVGDDPGGTGSVAIDGMGSAWSCTQQITVGGFGAGSLALNDGASVSAPIITIGAQGSVLGAGTIIGAVTSSGTVRPGTAGGPLAIQGSYTQTSAGTLETELGCAAFGVLAVTGNAALGGTLEVSFAGGGAPPWGRTFDVLTATSISGAFDQVISPAGTQVVVLADKITVTTLAGAPQLGIDGEAAGDRFGQAMANAGDLDGDGVNDLVVGAPLSDANGTSSGKVYAISGRTMDVLWSRNGSQAGARLGSSVAGAGDANGDGLDDVVVGAPYRQSSRGRARVLSGADGSVLHTKNGASSGDRFGYAVSGGVDIDNDGRDDFIVGAPRNDQGGSNAGKVYVYSGRNGSLLGTLVGENSGDMLGWSVAGIRRANGDSNADFAAGAPRNDDKASNAGKVYVVSGRNFSVLHTRKGVAGGDQFGRSLAALGRVNGDSRDDFAVGSPYHDRGGNSNAGRIDVFSGANGARLWSKKGQRAGDRLGWAVARAGDLDGDGQRDVLSGAPWNDGSGANAGRVYLRSGAGGASLGTLDGDADGDRFGFAVAGLGDIDGDGSSDYAAAAYLSDVNGADAGAVIVRFSSSCNGGAAAMVLGGPGGPGGRRVVGSGSLDGGDVVAMLAAWGDCAGCDEDRQGDGRVDVEDLMILLGANQ